MNNNKEIGNVIKLKQNLIKLQNEINKTENKLNNAKTPSEKARFERQLTQLRSLYQDCIEKIYSASMTVDIDPTKMTQDRRRK